ncbi:molybdopterin-dependent oxidoreductase [Lutimaribacter sp. EGI FJ00015]|uniref:Molybdopterin-dependent oxidoreductase n=1 Tax=Lutimaribacter degradans TaxID=2945989 RepID=A0ACC5ZWT4_9RHOB|nr:molybdopterin-dependent oxidoreductase [Lutimaribacter sp. EGI FJ00013]MCM2562633.1 molybdopterin-dependent oxidoreductase [Lutimaribacter sp. EGI FJ00013]MCO0613790.1 molybdopterin-dependent oxidoreductase [Lutimaribacter sp. EGI FJ00015]MCO0636727.1 molybdopterin-dependent oxidoreductase [Lutimaribacter sp. EGI FJ00014]
MDDQTAITRTGFKLNGQAVSVDADPGERLSHSLRERLGARDVKVGCNAGDCGACTVLVDGAAVCACLMPTARADGAQVDTLTGLVRSDEGARLALAFQAHQAAQCGICTPGMMVSAVALLRDVGAPTAQQVRDALGGVLCRCTGYAKIVDAIVAAGAGNVAQAEVSGAVGTALTRLDGAPKVDGREAFGDDVAPDGALALRVIRSPHFHARFTLGDIDGFRAAHPWVALVLTADDVPGSNAFGVIPGFEDQPVFAEGYARFRGEPIAAIVGSADQLARFDASDFPVTWEDLPPILDVAEAMADGAPELHKGHAQNVMTGGFVRHGQADDALARADVVAEGDFTTGFVEHAYIEPEAGFAEVVDGRVHVHACTQAPVMDQQMLAKALALPLESIRIVPTATGGGFGSKLDVSVQPFLALAALKLGQPVRMAYSRIESMQSTTKRHPAQISLKIGACKDGTLSGMHFEGLFNTGAYASWGPTVANRVPIHASGPYRVADYLAQARGIYTNGPPAGAFRGFGVPQSAIAQEVLFDELADQLGIDALDFRLKNALVNGVPTVCGQVFDQGVGIKPCFEALRPAWAEWGAACAAFNAENDTLKRGVGIAGGWYGCGNTSLPNPSTIKAGLRADGTVVLHQGAADIGQGSNTVITQIFAQALGVDPRDVLIKGGDTDVTPDAGKTSASRQTFVTGNAARLSGTALRRQVLALVNAPEDAVLRLGPDAHVQDGSGAHDLRLDQLPADSEGFVMRVAETYDPPTEPLDENGQGVPYAQFGYAAHLALVEVDTRLGTARVLRFKAAHDVGRAINPLLIEGQVEGGVAQGLGLALMEEYIPGRTENLHDYLIPTFGDMPEIETLVIEEEDAHGPFGAKGLGEHALIPTAPAILNAIARATGARLRQVPVTPARLRAALKEAGHA